MLRVLSTVLTLAFILTSEVAHANPKYAALVLDVDTGRVMYEKNASSRRYPASLTKMMTVYMTFDAIRKGKLSMNTTLKASKRAAAQPQTNISLRVGDAITVKQAIEALIVRSANDASVVLAEAIGGTEWNFAVQSTAKARQLGMRNTVFRNPHGLPDSKQYTTARDMAALGIALRRDFPQYYHFFKTTTFRFKGRTFKSHNKVLSQFDGVDGIKTGYIRASGFNLVSSVKRDGYNMIAVVMGGKSSKSRDAHMVSLLERSYAQLMKERDKPRMFAKAPTPTRKPQFETPLAMASVTPERGGSMGYTAPKPEIDIQVKDVVTTTNVPVARPFQLASLASSRAATSAGWGIQVGAFDSERAALTAAANAVNLARDVLKHSQIAVTDKGVADKNIHRARLANLSERQARHACAALVQANNACFVYKANMNQQL